MTQYLKVHIATREVIMGCGLPDPVDFIGPLAQAPVADEGYEFVLWQQDGARFSFKSRPSDRHVCKLIANSVVWEEPLTLDEFKAYQSDLITAAKIAANADHFVFREKRIAVDEASFREMQSTCAWVAMTQTMPANWPGGWKAMGDTGYVIFNTVPVWIEFYGTMVQTGMANFMKSQQLKALILNATTHAEVAAITWE